MFPEVTFGALECVTHARLCASFRVDSWPTLYFFGARDKAWAEYDGGRSPQLFSDFLRNRTGLRARPSRARDLVRLTPASLAAAAAPGRCALVLFHGGACPACHHWGPQLGALSFAYRGDANVTVAMLDCGRYAGACRARFPGVPAGARPDAFRLYADARWADFPEERRMSRLVARINRACRVARRSDGLLGDGAGRIAEADAIARRFPAADAKEELIAQMEGIPGAGTYVEAMRRFMDGGAERLRREMRRMREKLRQGAGSAAAMDRIKRSLNVFRAFMEAPAAAGEAL
jgi:hypothetical protein